MLKHIEKTFSNLNNAKKFQTNCLAQYNLKPEIYQIESGKSGKIHFTILLPKGLKKVKGNGKAK